MSIETQRLPERFRPYALSLLRIVAGFLFWQHGVWKLFGWFGGKPVPAHSLFWHAGIIETVFAPLLILGILTRTVALIFSGEMAVAYLTQHLPSGFWPVGNHGVEALEYCFIFFLLAAAGGGCISLDRAIINHSSQQSSGFTRFLNRFYPVAVLLLRIACAIIYWNFGTRKLFGWFGSRPAKFPRMLWFAGLMETIGTPLVAAGLLMRPLGFLFSGEMAVAFWTSHFPRGPGFWPIQNGGEPAVLLCFIYLFLFAAGAERFSLDHVFFGRRRRTPELEFSEAGGTRTPKPLRR